MNYEFEIVSSIDGWFIRLITSNFNFNMDESIANKLNLSLEEYHNILKMFGANISNSSNDIFFEDYNEAQNCQDYLTDRFIVMLQLTN